MVQRRPKSGEFLMPPGEVYTSDAPEFLGRFSVRQDVLKADNPQKPVGWTVECRSGCEIFLLDEHDKPIQKALTSRDDIKEGLRIYAPTLVGGVLATVVRDKDGDLVWETKGFMGDLDFDSDDRHVWITATAINKKLLR